jgi:xanthine/CO dehydrogenase XdhC/CoxF family maturation factor
MIISADGKTWGSVGGGCGENQVRSAALRCLLTEKKPALIEADLSDDLGTRGGDVCGGKMWIFVEPYF